MEEYDKTKSRKWKLVLLIVLVATLGTFVPPLISSWVFKATTPLVILTGASFVSLISIVVGAYFGINVWQKKITQNASFKVEAEAKVGDEEGEA